MVTGDGSRVPAILLANKSDLREESTVMIMTITIIMINMFIMDTFMITIMITKSIFMITN